MANVDLSKNGPFKGALESVKAWKEVEVEAEAAASVSPRWLMVMMM